MPVSSASASATKNICVSMLDSDCWSATRAGLSSWPGNGPNGEDAHPVEPEFREHEAECAAEEPDDHDLDEMLTHDVDAARAQRASQAADRCCLQELRQHQAEGVEHADEQEHHGHGDLDLGFVADDLVHLHPRIHIDDAVVVLRARKPPVAPLLVGVVVDERLIALPLARSRQLRPVLHPDAIGGQKLFEAADLGVGPHAVRVAVGPELERFASSRNGMNRFSGRSKLLLLRS